MQKRENGQRGKAGFYLEPKDINEREWIGVGGAGEGMLCAAEWEDEDEDRSVGDEGSEPENICSWPWELYLRPSVCFRVGWWIFARENGKGKREREVEHY